MSNYYTSSYLPSGRTQQQYPPLSDVSTHDGSFNGNGCATSPAPLMQPSAMLPAYASGIDYSGFYPTYQNAFNGAMLPNYSSPVSSLYPGSNFVDITAAMNETSPPTDPSQKHRSPEEHTKYLIKRKKNNEAAKMSRIKRTEREKNLQARVDQLTAYIQEMHQKNQKQFLEAGMQVATLQAEIDRLRSQQCQCMNKTAEKENQPFVPLYQNS